MLTFIDFEASFVMLFNDKVSKNSPKKGNRLIDFEPFSIQLLFVNLFKRPILKVLVILSVKNKALLALKIDITKSQSDYISPLPCLYYHRIA